jgi:hypothetical protein
MTYQTEDEDLFDGEHSELAEAIVELRREIADLKARTEYLQSPPDPPA